MLDDNATSRNARRRRDDGADAVDDSELELSGTALSVPETDPERIAFNLWNEGRVDEAIQFLEREIAGRRSRYEAIPDLPALARIEQRKIEPVSDWRERHRSALSPADFNAFGSVRQIDLVAKPADAILPHPPRRALRAAWIMGLGLAFVGLSAGAVLWTGGETQKETPLSEVQPTAQVAPATIIPATEVKAESKVATVEPVRVLPPEDEIGTVLPPEEVAAQDVPPDEVVPRKAPTETEAADADAPPPDDEVVPDIAADDPAETAPEATASIDPAPADAEQAPIIVARVPRQRPEPPATARPEPPAAAPRSARVDRPDPPVVYAPPAPAPGFAPGPAPQFDPMNPRQTLTPAEYQVLLERRAWAQNYSARRRAYAERRVLVEEPPGFLGGRGPIIQLFGN